MQIETGTGEKKNSPEKRLRTRRAPARSARTPHLQRRSACLRPTGAERKSRRPAPVGGWVGGSCAPLSGLCGPPPPALSPLSHCNAMGFAHLRCNSITALIKIFISRPDCLLICWKHMLSEVQILDSALLPKVQFNTGGWGRRGKRSLPIFFIIISSSLIWVAVNYKDTPLS